MLGRQLGLQPGMAVGAVNISDNGDIPAAIQELEILHPKPVIVLVGGAGGVAWLEKFPMRNAIGIVARLVEETQAIVVDGGTQARIMKEIGGYFTEVRINSENAKGETFIETMSL